MRKTLPCLILSVLLILFLTGCGKVDPLVGEYSSPSSASWGTIDGKEVERRVSSHETPLILTVNKDGTYTWETANNTILEGKWEHLDDEDAESFKYKLLEIDSSTGEVKHIELITFDIDGHDIGAFTVVNGGDFLTMYFLTYFDRIN